MSLFQLHSTNHLAHEGRLREIDLEAGARAVPAGGVMTRTRAALGIMRDATTSAPWGASTGLGQVGAGNARSNCVRICLRKEDRYRPALRPRPRKPGLEPRVADESPSRRAVVERRQASAPAAEGRRKPISSWRAPHPLVRTVLTCVCRRSASFFLFCFLSLCREALHPPPRKRGRGTTRSVVEGASHSSRTVVEGDTLSPTPLPPLACARFPSPR